MFMSTKALFSGFFVICDLILFFSEFVVLLNFICLNGDDITEILLKVALNTLNP